MAFPFEITEEYTGRFLMRYHCINVEGLLYVEITNEIIERVRTMQLLSVIGAGHIEGFNCTQSYLIDKVKFFLLAPNVTITELSSDEDFGVTFNNGNKNYWFVKSLRDDKLKMESIIQCEALYIEVGTKEFWLTFVPYENPFFYSRVFTNKIKLSLIGI